MTGDLANNFLAIDAAGGKTLDKFNTRADRPAAASSASPSATCNLSRPPRVSFPVFFGGTGNATIVVFSLR